MIALLFYIIRNPNLLKDKETIITAAFESQHKLVAYYSAYTQFHCYNLNLVNKKIYWSTF